MNAKFKIGNLLANVEDTRGRVTLQRHMRLQGGIRGSRDTLQRHTPEARAALETPSQAKFAEPTQRDARPPGKHAITEHTTETRAIPETRSLLRRFLRGLCFCQLPPLVHQPPSREAHDYRETLGLQRSTRDLELTSSNFGPIRPKLKKGLKSLRFDGIPSNLATLLSTPGISGMLRPLLQHSADLQDAEGAEGLQRASAWVRSDPC